MSKDTCEVISKSIHECGQIINSVTCLVTDVSFAVKPDPPFDFERPFTVIAGPYIPPPQYRARLELSGYCESLTVTTTEMPDDRRVCPKCGMDVPLPAGMEPVSKHDGWLDAMESSSAFSARIEYFDLHPPTALLMLSGGYGDIESNSIAIDPKQALSLLAWLRQEEETLKGLAKE